MNHRIDTRGLRCPQPVLKLALATAELPPGTLVEIVGDCSTFEADIRAFCARRHRTVLFARDEGDARLIAIHL